MRKYGLLMLLALSSIFSSGQISQPSVNSNFQQFATPTTWTRFNGTIYTFNGLVNGAYADTASANATPIRLAPGAQIRVGDKLYLRNSSATAWIEVGSGTGSVTSVGLTMPSIMSVSGSPVTGSGTLAVSLATQSANTVFAGPTTGGAAIPTFRALVSSDVPSLSSLYWPKIGASGYTVSTSFVGTLDSNFLAFKVNNFPAGMISRYGRTSSTGGVNFSGNFAFFGPYSAGYIQDSIRAGVFTTGYGNVVYGIGAGWQMGGTADTFALNQGRSVSNANSLFGNNVAPFMQRDPIQGGANRGSIFGYGSCFSCLSLKESSLFGAYIMENGYRGEKNSVIGSNGLRTGNDASNMSVLGAYGAHYTGCAVSGVTITAGGSGYTTATVTFSAPLNWGSPGSCYATATGTAVISGGAIVGVTMTGYGCGYNKWPITYFSGTFSGTPTVTITGDGTGATGTPIITCGYNTTNAGHAAGWMSRAPQNMLYLGAGTEPSNRWFDQFGGTMGYGAGVHSSVSSLTNLSNSWALFTNAKVSTNRTAAFGAPVGDSTLKFVFNGHTGDSTITVNDGGVDIEKGLRVRGLSHIYGSSSRAIPMVNSVGSFANSPMTADPTGGTIRIDNTVNFGAYTNAFAFLVRNDYDGDASANAAPLIGFRSQGTSTTHKWMIGSLAPNAPAGTYISTYHGRATSAGNMAIHNFYYAGSNDAGNHYALSMPTKQGLFKVYNSGNAVVGTAMFDEGYKFGVDGKVKINDSLRALSGVKFSGLPTNAQARVVMIDPNGELHSVDTTGLFASGGGGGVTSVSGTAGRITSTGGATPVIDIDATYVGQASITTLGTIATGVWNGTAIGPTFGGTGITTYATGDILYASASNTLSKLAAGTDGHVLTLTSGIPSWAPSAGGGGSPAGNYGNLQLNRNGAFATPGSDSLDYENSGGLKVKNIITARIDVAAKQTVIGTDATDSYPGIWFGNVANDVSNSFVYRAAGVGTVVNTPSGEWVELRVANDFGSHNVRWDGVGLRVGGAGSAPTARLHIATGGTTAAGTAPFKLTSGTNMTTAEAGAFEYNGTSLFFSPSTTRLRTVLTDNSIPSNGQIPIGNGTNYTNANITSTDGTVTITNGAGTINLAVGSEGTYTPSLFNTTNVAASSSGDLYYKRVGDWIHVWGEVTIDATTALTISEFGLSIPIAVDFTTSNELAGNGSFEDNTIIQIKGDITNDRAMFRFTPQTATNNTYSINFSYKFSAP